MIKFSSYLQGLLGTAVALPIISVFYLHLDVLVIPWATNGDLFSAAALTAIGAVTALLCAYTLKIGTIPTAALPAGILCFATGHGSELILTALTFFSHMCLGWTLCRLAKVKLNSKIAQVGIGAGIAGTTLSILSIHQSIFVTLFTSLYIPICILMAHRKVIYLASAIFQNKSPQHLSFNHTAISSLVSGILFTNTFFCLLPDRGYDSQALHLMVASQVNNLEGWSYNPNFYSMAIIPLLPDWILAISYCYGGEISAKLTNLIFNVLLIWVLVKMIFENISRTTYYFKASAFALALSTPLALTETITIHMEVLWGFFMALCAWSILKTPGYQRGSPDEDNSPIFFSAAMLAFSISSKHFTLLLAPIFFAAQLAKCSRFNVDTLRKFPFSAIVTLPISILCAIFPYAHAYVKTGNPVFPFFNGFFKSPLYPASNHEMPIYQHNPDISLPISMVFDSGRFIEGTIGAPGFQLATLLLPAHVALYYCLKIRIRPQPISKMLFAAYAISWSCLLFVLFFQNYLRYVYPFILFNSVAAVGILGACASRLLSNNTILRVPLFALVFLTIILNMVFYCAGTWCYRITPIASSFTNYGRDKLNSLVNPTRVLVDTVNSLNTERNPVAFICQEIYGARLKSEALYPNWYNKSFEKELNGVSSESDLNLLIRKWGFKYFIISRERESQPYANWLMAFSMEIQSAGHLTLRAINEDFLHSRELLDDPMLLTDIIQPPSKITDKILLNGKKGYKCTVSSPMIKSAPVVPNSPYICTVEASSPPPNISATVRTQINWHSKDNEFLGSSIQTHIVTNDPRSITMHSISPPNASYAIVFGTSHDNQEAIIYSLSLK